MKPTGSRKNKLEGESEAQGPAFADHGDAMSPESVFSDTGKKYKVLFDNAPVGISIVDSKRNIIEANATLEKVARITKKGLKEGKYLNRKYFYSDGRVMPPDELPTVIALRKNRPVVDVEMGIFDEGQNTFWVQVSVAPLDKDGNFGVVITQDITDRKILQKKLAESEERYRQLMETCGLGIGYYSIDGKVLMFNQVATENLGGKTTDYIGKNLTEVFGKETGQIYNDRIKIVAESDKPVQYEDYVELSGSPGWYLSTHSRILGHNGEVDGVLVIANNITEIKSAEKKLKESRKKLQNLATHLEEVREEEKSEIALNLHDDLGQKLTALNLDIAWIKSRMGVQSLAVRRKFNDMSKMINETIDSIREISSFLRPSMLYDLGLVPAFEWQLKKTEEQSGIKCRFCYEPKEFKIDNHISLILFRVLQESLTNIIRHSKASATDVNLYMRKNRIELLIKDNGIGIDKYKVNSLTSMGLAGIKERVRSVNGKVSVTGEKGVGTVIKVFIPLRK